MTINTSLHRWTLATLLVAVSAVTLAPTAHADQGWRRWKHPDRGSWGRPGPRMVLRERGHDGPGPIFAGMLGGMLLGAVLSSHSQPFVAHERACERPTRDRYYEPPTDWRERSYEPPVARPERTYEPPVARPEHEQASPPQAQQAPRYRYEDGNGERWWDTLDECTDAARGNRGPRVIHVVNDETNDVVKTLYWKHDHWVSDQDRDGSDD